MVTLDLVSTSLSMCLDATEVVAIGLHFNLRSLYEPDPEADPSLPPLKQLIPKMQYIPLDLDKERPEYVERLEFFKEPFIFQYGQLNVFHKSLVDRFPSPQNGSQEEEDDDIEEVEMS